MTEKSLRVTLVALERFVGVSAVEGGIGVMTDGVGLPVEWLLGVALTGLSTCMRYWRAPCSPCRPGAVPVAGAA